MTLSKEKFDKLFTEFSDAVKEKKYAKMPYQTWKSLKDSLCLLSQYQYVDIYHTAAGIKVIFQNSTPYEADYVFEWDDCSFGSFLNNKYNNTFDIHPLEVKYDNNSVYVKSDSGWEQVSASKDASMVIGGDSIKANDNAINISSEGIGTILASKADKADLETLNLAFEKMSKIVESAGCGIKKNIKEEKDKTMTNMLNFDFGPCEDANVRMSMYGIAVKNASGTFVSYDTNTDSIMDVDVFNFDGRKFLFKMPVAVKDVKIGDVVIHARKPMFVVSAETKSLKVVDPVNGEKKEIMLTRSPFGFDFATKVVNLFDNIGKNAVHASADNPFGNMWMLMLLGNEDEAIDSNLLPFMFMNNGSMNMNPMMMYMLMDKDKSSTSLLPMMLMMNNNTNSAAN